MLSPPLASSLGLFMTARIGGIGVHEFPVGEMHFPAWVAVVPSLFLPWNLGRFHLLGGGACFGPCFHILNALASEYNDQPTATVRKRIERSSASKYEIDVTLERAT